MTYQIVVPLEVSISKGEVFDQMLEVYDATRIGGSFNVLHAGSAPGLLGLFQRSGEDDRAAVLARVPFDAPLTDEVLAQAAGAQLLGELTRARVPPDLSPLLDALRAGRFTADNLAELR